MRRRLFTLCSALSLLLCVAVCGLWVRSYQVGDWVGRDEWMMQAGFSSALGRLSYQRVHWPSPDSPNHDNDVGAGWCHVRTVKRILRAEVTAGDSVLDRWLRSEVDVGLAGVRVLGGHVGDARLWTVAVPHWMAAVAALPLPGAWLFARLRRRRRGLCPTCGYDLPASPQRCPECGEATAR